MILVKLSVIAVKKFVIIEPNNLNLQKTNLSLNNLFIND